MAYYSQKPKKELIFHSNLDTQYTSTDFAKVIKKYQMTHSFSYKGSPYDHAYIEAFNAVLKKKK